HVTLFVQLPSIHCYNLSLHDALPILKNNIPFFVRHFQTGDYARQQGVSTQMAARELRYAWFEELRVQENATWIAVAQHQNDHIEDRKSTRLNSSHVKVSYAVFSLKKQ